MYFTLNDRPFLFDNSVLNNVFKAFISDTELTWSLKPGPCSNDTLISGEVTNKKQERGKPPICSHY